jgi:hypothetical protein
VTGRLSQYNTSWWEEITQSLSVAQASSGDRMILLDNAELKRISVFLGKHDPKSTVTQLGGLLTVPALQANTIRIETLVHLAVMNCHGRRKPGLTEIDHWQNRQLASTWIASLEDPVVLMLREKLKWRPHKFDSTYARHGGGLTCSSVEVSAM